MNYIVWFVLENEKIFIFRDKDRYIPLQSKCLV